MTLTNLAKIAGLKNYIGDVAPLGGGEVNETYLLKNGNQDAIIRIARDVGQDTLRNEAMALNLLDLEKVPKLLHFDANKLVDGRMWIAETYISGSTQPRLSAAQYSNLGQLLAQVHQVKQTELGIVDVWERFIYSCRAFGDETYLADHPDEVIKNLFLTAKIYIHAIQPTLDGITPSLIHSDATPSNTLVDRDEVGLIDWEFSKFSDPMAEFSTIYYEDTEYNQGKWRTQITKDEKEALFEGYQLGGGIIDEARIQLWMNVDKLGAAIFLYWRIHESQRDINDPQTAQYQLDLDNLIASLHVNLHA